MPPRVVLAMDPCALDLGGLFLVASAGHVATWLAPATLSGPHLSADNRSSDPIRPARRFTWELHDRYRPPHRTFGLCALQPSQRTSVRRRQRGLSASEEAVTVRGWAPRHSTPNRAPDCHGPSG